jgi:hypothetical protein
MLLRLCTLRVAHKHRVRARSAGDRLLRVFADDAAQVLFEIFKAHRCELFTLGWLRHRSAPFRVPSNGPAATTNIAIAPSVTAQSRTMIRWNLFMVAHPSGNFSSLRVNGFEIERLR